MNATQRAILVFTKYDAGRDAGQWTIVGRRGQVRARLEAGGVRHGKTPWDVFVQDRTIDGGAVKTVFVEVPWRLSSQPLTEEEQARVLALASERIGEYTVVD